MGSGTLFSNPSIEDCIRVDFFEFGLSESAAFLSPEVFSEVSISNTTGTTAGGGGGLGLFSELLEEPVLTDLDTLSRELLLSTFRKTVDQNKIKRCSA